MIPKIIHYIWLSNDPYPEEVQKCMDSWKLLDGYDFIKWDTTNFDINSNSFVKKMYEAKLYAFASDYIRLQVLYEHGGIYLDSDIEIIKTLDDLLDNKCFFAQMTKLDIAGYVFGCEKGNEVIKYLLDLYKNIEQPEILEKVISRPLWKYKWLNKDSDIRIYTEDYISGNKRTGKPYENTHLLHHFSGMWRDNYSKYIKN